MSDAGEQFETADAGAAHCVPKTAGAMRKGHHVMIKGSACKIVEITTSKTGKHGHAKAHIVALDIFTGKKLEDLCPTSHNMSEPIVTRTEYTLMDISPPSDNGNCAISLLDDKGCEKADLDINPSNTEHKHDLLQKLFDEGKSVVVTVLSAIGKEVVVDAREQQ